MVSRGKRAPHKLSRAPSWFSCSKYFCKRNGEGTHSSPHGQCFSSELHQQTRGTHSFVLNSLAHDLWTWCLANHVNLTAQTHSGGNQYPSRLGVEGLSGLKRLEAQSTSFCSHQQTLGSPRDRPVCQSLDQATSQFCELETRSRGPGNRCIRPRLEPMEGVCFSPIFIDRSLPQASPSTAGCELVIVTPVLPAQAWYPLLLELCIDYPVLLLQDPSLLMRGQEVQPLDHRHLAGWLVSIDHSKRRKFLRRLRKSSYQPGAPILPSLMHHPGTRGIAGVWNTTVFPSHHLSQQF